MLMQISMQILPLLRSVEVVALYCLYLGFGCYVHYRSLGLNSSQKTPSPSNKIASPKICTERLRKPVRECGTDLFCRFILSC
jgi:hypothetical protein